MIVRQLTQAEKDEIEDHLKRHPASTKLTQPCWLCGHSTKIANWADHVDRHRREGWKPRPHTIAKRPAEQIFAEWQQADATIDDYDSLREYKEAMSIGNYRVNSHKQAK